VGLKAIDKRRQLVEYQKQAPPQLPPRQHQHPAASAAPAPVPAPAPGYNFGQQGAAAVSAWATAALGAGDSPCVDARPLGLEFNPAAAATAISARLVTPYSRGALVPRTGLPAPFSHCGNYYGNQRGNANAQGLPRRSR
jgi:hypothetical protein